MKPNRKQQAQIEKNRYERGWAVFEARDSWRLMRIEWDKLGAHGRLRLKREHPDIYKVLADG